ncbi:Gfo/Idh/MocA family oxidoreductase [Polluticaenibacter yanchengensis]|uniref:Gfo/Idh/MocA family oxidoreductase n=1 Tax=Polluticaenibacter yanchengensis TaxID=3014562 RepID=A0ABT4UNK9_9BACT|nr:Gfo/Idh/MocA family oxidoreductase [Chitinophagaceae bacterium LY-5]
MSTKIINAAICSFGLSGRVFHAPFLHYHPGFRFYAVWERSAKKAQEIYSDVLSYNTYEAMLADETIELVVVNTPNYTHYEYTLKALEAGKHVLVEKPFTTTVEEAEHLVKLAGEKQLKLAVYHNRRYDSDYKTVRKVLEEGLLGNIAEAEIHFDRFTETLSVKAHKETPGPGTGNVYDLGSHIIDQALQLFGWPDAVYADISKIRSISRVDDYFEIILYYPASRVRLHSSMVCKVPLPGYTLQGSKGTFIKPKTNLQEEALQEGKIPVGDHWGVEPEKDWGTITYLQNDTWVQEKLPSLQGNYMALFSGLHQYITTGEPVTVTGEDGLKVIKIIEAAYKSSNSGTKIKLK